MDLAELIETGDTLLQETLEAVCRYHEARDSSAPAEEVEQLHKESQALLQSLEKFQLMALGGHEVLDY